jgi:PAS domain S-box-containing protein
MSEIKILYVDSQKDYASTLLANLIDENYNVKFSDNIKDALISYSQDKPNIIITDALVKDLNTFSFLKKIKELDSTLKLIVVTNYTNSEIFLNAIELKVDKFLFKHQSFKNINNYIKKLKINEQNNEQKLQLINLGDGYYYIQKENKIIIHDDTIHLTSQEGFLINELIRLKGNFISSDSLQNIIGKGDRASVDTLRTVIRRIRKKTYSKIIQNKSGIGYKINLVEDYEEKIKLTIAEKIYLDIKILIIKGDKKKNDSLKFQLEKLGLNCENSYTIEQAKFLLKIEKFDYIISDLSLPDGDSIEFIRDIKEIKFIILSNEQDIHYKEYLYFKGIIDYIIDTHDVNYLAYNIYKSIVKVETNTKFNNILVIDKSKRICEQIKDLLQPRNYNVDILNELTHAKELLKTKHYSLVILDMNIEHNFDFLHDIKLEIDKSISFIMLTDANRSYDLVRESYKNGADESLRKPIFAEEFVLKVDQIIEHSKLVGKLIQQKKLIESYKKIVDKSAIVSKTDRYGKITYVNNIFCDISGYSKNELLGKNHNIIRHPDTPNELFKHLWEKISIEKKIWHGIIKNKNKNNQTYIVKTSIMPILDYNNNIIEFLALRNDITNTYKGKNDFGKY